MLVLLSIKFAINKILMLKFLYGKGNFIMFDWLIQSFQIKTMSFFEAGMLICFGASWPFAVRKTYKTKSVKGKSKLFLSLIILGYIFGMINKILNSVDIVFWLYVINLLLVSSDFILCLIYRNREEQIENV